MQTIEFLSGGQLIRRPLDPGQESPRAEAREWIDNGWLPSLTYFQASEPGTDFTRSVTALSDQGSSRPEPDAVSFTEPTTAPVTQDPRTVAGVLLRRRSTRSYSDVDRTTKRELEALVSDVRSLLTERLGDDMAAIRFRLVNYRVDGLEPGTYSLDPVLRPLTLADYSETMVEIMCGMEAARSADATIVLSFDAADRQRAFPYERALRELYIDAGRIAQWFILRFEEVGLGSLITPATNDRALGELLGLEPGEYPLYTISFGPKPGADLRSSLRRS